MDLGDIENTSTKSLKILVTSTKSLENTCNRCGEGLQPATYFTRSFIS